MSDLRDVWTEFVGEEMSDKLDDLFSYRSVDGGTTATSVPATFNEFVGAIDDVARAIITISTVVLTANGITSRRGDRWTLSGRTWKVIDIRDDEVGEQELRCDTTQEDN